MSIKSKAALAIAAAATATLAAGLGIAGTASAATPSCGPACINIFSKNFGSYSNPQFVMDVYRQGSHVGQPIILFRESNSDPAEDFSISYDGQVSDAFQAGLVSSSFNLHYGCNWSLFQAKCTNTFPDLYIFEVQYTPFGVDSGLCVGAPSGAANTKVTLQPCGVNAGTLWAADTLDSCPANPLYSLEVQAINGLNTNYSHPTVLTYPAAGFPTDKPRPQLFLKNLTGFTQTGGTGRAALCGGLAVTGPDNNQLWGAVAGVLP